MSNSKDFYPLKFKFIAKDKIWGGTRIGEVLNKSIASQHCGETWELATVGEDISIVDGGVHDGKKINELIDQFKDQFVGKKIYQKFKNELPLLIKFIDAERDLSIQVHPDDQLAKAKHNSLGKSELWYILDADVDAQLIAGFEKKVTKEEFIKHLSEGKIEQILHREKVKKGDVFFMPSGRIHNIGAGMLIAEIQQASDITYRIHDFDRQDLSGTKRELHIEDALEALDFEPTRNGKIKYEPKINELVNLVKCSYFTTNKINFDTPIIRDFSQTDSFVVYICVSGELTLSANEHEVVLTKGNVYFIPAAINSVLLSPKEQSLILEVFIA